jgi:hypothetical protein
MRRVNEPRHERIFAHRQNCLLELAKRSIDSEVLELIKQVDDSVSDEPENEPRFFTMWACHSAEGFDTW